MHSYLQWDGSFPMPRHNADNRQPVYVPSLIFRRAVGSHEKIRRVAALIEAICPINCNAGNPSLI